MLPRIDAFEDQAGYWRWHLIAANGKTVATSGESFYSKSNALRAGQTAKLLMAQATVAVDPSPLGSALLREAARRRLKPVPAAPGPRTVGAAQRVERLMRTRPPR